MSRKNIYYIFIFFFAMFGLYFLNESSSLIEATQNKEEKRQEKGVKGKDFTDLEKALRDSEGHRLVLKQA